MRLFAWLLVALATGAAGFDAKLLLIDIVLADLRRSGGWFNWVSLGIALAVSAFFVGLPGVAGAHWIARDHPGWSVLLSLGSLAASAVTFVFLANAFTP